MIERKIKLIKQFEEECKNGNMRGREDSYIGNDNIHIKREGIVENSYYISNDQYGFPITKDEFDTLQEKAIKSEIVGIRDFKIDEIIKK